MDIQGLAALYQSKTDGELLHLAAQIERLTSDARFALTSEITRRRLDASSVGDLDNRNKLAQTEKHSQCDNRGQIRTGEFIEDVLRLYHRERWLFVRLVFPAVLIAYTVVMLGLHLGRQIAHHLSPEMGHQALQAELREIWFITDLGYFVSWIACCVSFGAICSAVEQIEAGLSGSVQDSFAAVRERLDPCLKLSVLLFALMFTLLGVAMLLSNSVSLASRSSLGRLGSIPFWLTFDVPMILGLLGLSRFGLAMPAVILDDAGIALAMVRSDELTQGRWLILAVLLFKSIAGSYVAGLLPFWLARWILTGIDLPSWFPWLLSAASVAAVTVVEPVMFIGFALLYVRTSTPVPAPSVQAQAMVT